MSPIDGLPLIPASALPADVRNGSAKDQQAYRTALGFEQVMLGELMKSMVPEDSEMGQGPYAGTIQEAFGTSLIANGGIGLGAQLFRTMQETAR
jgi:hypothetical protein